MSQKLEIINTLDTGLDGIPVCTSDLSLTRLDEDGMPILLYKGYSIYDLIKGCFEESATLLLYGELPNQKQLQSFCRELASHAHLEEPILSHIKTYPKGVHMMDFLMTTLSFARMFDEDYRNATWQMPKNDARLANLILNAGVHLGAKIPAIIASGYRIQKRESPIPADSSLGFAANFFEYAGHFTGGGFGKCPEYCLDSLSGSYHQLFYLHVYGGGIVHDRSLWAPDCRGDFPQRRPAWGRQ